MDAIEALMARRSIRSYTDEKPTAEQLETITAAMNNAPSARACFITVVTDAAVLAAMDEAVYTEMLSQEGFGKQRASIPGYRPLYGAPAVIVISAPDGLALGGVNAACACTAGAVAATALGLGSCFVMGPGAAARLIPDLKETLKVPEGYTPFCGLLVGYANDPELFKHVVEKLEPAIV